MTAVIRHSSNRPVTDRLHPVVYKLAVGLVVLYVVSAWAMFYRAGDPELLLTAVSGLLLFAILIPFALWLTWRRHRIAEEPAKETLPFRAWMFGDFETWQGRLKGRDAAIDILLPLAAVALGLMLIGIVFATSAHSIS